MRGRVGTPGFSLTTTLCKQREGSTARRDRWDTRRRSSGYRPRSSRIQWFIVFFPEPIPRLPMPRYLANGLSARTGRTRMPSSPASNNSMSPARTPSARRMASGTVIWPFAVIFACFFKVHSPYSLSGKEFAWLSENCPQSLCSSTSSSVRES